MFPKKSVFLILLFISFSLFAQQPYYRHYTVNDGLASSTVYKIIQDKKGFIWIATENGAQRFDGKTFETFSKENGLLDNTILDLFEDSKGRIWFLSLSGQIAYYDNGNLHTTANDSILKQVDAKSNLTYFAEDKKGTVYISASGSEGVYKISDLSVINYPARTNWNGINYMWIVSDTIFIANYAGSILKLNGVDFELKYHVSKSHSDLKGSKDWMFRSTVLSKDTLLFSFFSGFMLLKNNGDSYDVEKLDFKISGKVNNLFNSKNGSNIWIATTNGAILWSKSTKKIISKQFSGKIINAITEDIEGNIWFGTTSNGIYYLNKNSF